MEKPHKDVKWFQKLDTSSDSSKAKGSVRDKGHSLHNLFEKNVKDAYRWIDSVAVILELQERKAVAWNILREVVHILRDRMTLNEVLHLSAQLPVLIRGMYFEGFSFKESPNKFHVEEVEDRLNEVLRAVPKIKPQQAFGAVLATLYEHVSPGEMRDIWGTFPKDIKDYWDESIEKVQQRME